MAPTKMIKFCEFTVYSKPNNVTLSACPEKSLKLKKKTFLCDRRLTERLTQLTNLVQFRYLGPPAKYLHARFFMLDIVKIKGNSHKKKCKIFIFSKMALTIFINFCGFIVHSNPRSTIGFSRKNPCK